MQKLTRYCLTLALGLPLYAGAEAPDGSWLQLQRLNQTQRLELERMQEAYRERQSPLAPPRQRQAQQELNRQQRQAQQAQQALQRGQQHQRLIREQRERVTPTERSRRLDGVFQRQRFRQTQQRQLQRFERQQQMYIWPR